MTNIKHKYTRFMQIIKLRKVNTGTGLSLRKYYSLVVHSYITEPKYSVGHCFVLICLIDVSDLCWLFEFSKPYVF